MPGSFCWDKSIPVEVLRWEAANSSSPFRPAGRHPWAARKIFFKSHHGVKNVGQKTTGQVQALQMAGALMGKGRPTCAGAECPG